MRAFVQKPKAAALNVPAASRERDAAGKRAESRTPLDESARDTKFRHSRPVHAINAISVHPPGTLLAISHPGDASEQEAHRMSEHVMRMPQSRDDPAHGVVRSALEPTPVRPLPLLQPADPRNAASLDEASDVRNVLSAQGHPLDAHTRAFMESRFQRDFSHVKLHSDALAIASADAVKARAYTVGHHIVLNAGQYAPGTTAGRALLAHELVHVIQQSSISTHGARLLQRDASGPTYGNLPRDLPAPGSSGDVVRLRNVNGTWKEVGPKYVRTARGNYDFVVKDGEIFAVKSKRTVGGGYGHTEAARGERVNWAGQVDFESGKVKTWNDGTGHYRSLSSMRDPAVRAGLPDEKFVQHPDNVGRPRPRGSLPQLPVEQPATKPRVPGEQPKVPAGPPRMEEFEQRFGKKAATAPATTTAALAEEAGSVLKVQGRAASALSKIGSAAGWVADFLMPGPQDAIMLMVQFAMTYAEAQEAARAQGMRTGFGHGLAAGLLRLSRGWVRDNLAPKVISRSVASEVAATTGYREKGVVQGLVAGISFAERLNADQRKALLKEATRAMRAKGDDVTLRARWERGYTAYDIIDLSVALAPRIDEILEEARKNEELRQAAEAQENFKKYGPLMALAPLFEQ
ncbi:DUF4157 domain-containing protein [Achromobacter spanius]|nr:DUF4157 domain-containing protein [Achromobacter spanius]